MQNNVFYSNKTLNLRGKLMALDGPKVMGILNITPDSFYDGGKFTETDSILEHVKKLLKDGADFIDIGGYSSRPGATDISEKEEIKRVIPIIENIVKKYPETAISIDTFRSTVARQAIKSGACMINDISGGELDPHMFETVAELKAPYILMHMRGTPQTMNSLTDYKDLLKEIIDYFQLKISRLHAMGVHDIVVDPGFGFAKNVHQNFELLKNLSVFKILNQPILAGLSRKSMIWRTLNTDARNALNGTTALNAVALMNGATILRVHDVKEAIECVRLIEKL